MSRWLKRPAGFCGERFSSTAASVLRRVLWGFVGICSTGTVLAGSMTLAWTPPTTNADGSPLTDLAQYGIYWRCGSGVGYPSSTRVPAPNSVYVLDGLPDGQTCRSVVTAINALGGESALSNEVQKLIPVVPVADPTTGPVVTWSVSQPVPFGIRGRGGNTVAGDGRSVDLVLAPDVTAEPGDVVLIGLNINPAASGSFPAPSVVGFELVGGVDDGGWGRLVVLRKLTSAAETEYRVTFAGAHDFVSGAVLVLSGVDANNPTPTVVTARDTSLNATYAIPAMTTKFAGSMDVAFVGQAALGSVNGAAAIFGPWAGLTEVVDIARAGAWSAIGVAQAVRSTAGPQAATNVTAAASDQSLAIRLEIKAR